MVGHIDTVWAGVTDMDRSVRFYTALLGQEPSYASSHWTAFRLGAVTLGLHADMPGGAAGFVVSIEVADLETAAHACQEAGGEVDPEIHETPRGHVQMVFDPDRNRIQLFRAATG